MRDAEKSGPLLEQRPASRVSLFSNLEVVECGLDFEKQAAAEGFRFIAGIDEVGRGCLAGPVVAAACILDLSRPLPEGLDDSKKLTEQQRERIAEELREHAVSFAVGEIAAEEIDRINILQATREAMKLAIAALDPAPDYLLIDALNLKEIGLPQRAIIKGDCVSASIAAASVIAKTHRDRLMRDYDAIYPQYGFAGHVGYGTKVHLDALKNCGPCPLHRRSFRGVVQS